MSAQPCRVDTPDAHEHHPHLTLVPARRDRPDRPPKPCIRCRADRIGDPFPFKSKLCSRCIADRGDDLPKIPCKVSSAPLADMLERIIAREEALEAFIQFRSSNRRRQRSAGCWDEVSAVESRREGVCGRAGISTKSLAEWRNGVRVMVPFNTADKVLQNLGVFWDDVWTPENTPPGEYEALKVAMG